MRRSEALIGIGVLLLAAALTLPAFAQARFRRGGWDRGGPMMGWGGRMGVAPQAGQAGAVTTLDAAAARAREALGAYAAGDALVVAEVMEFSNHFYVLAKEKSSGRGAMELIVERNGFIHPEPGPNMMWNTKYGHMAGAGMMGGGMMRGWGPGYGGPGVQPVSPQAQPIPLERAKELATQYLTRAVPGAVPDQGTTFYGYFTFDVERDGKPTGMLSVNAFTGQVWYHTWHGTFVSEKEF